MASARSTYSGPPVSAPKRSRARAATELADGNAPSRMSLGRVMSSSASLPVVNRPPCTGSQNSASMASAAVRASATQRASPVASPSRVKASTMAA